MFSKLHRQSLAAKADASTFPRLRRNVLMFSKLHRSVWPYMGGEFPKRSVPMFLDLNGAGPEFEYQRR
ncbi:hypothetical protein AAVH_38825 [Aphelenchoides avenae]|nr:hypothetical protein AAVH_38825 [Aphelenchus avenae]